MRTRVFTMICGTLLVLVLSSRSHSSAQQSQQPLTQQLTPTVQQQTQQPPNTSPSLGVPGVQGSISNHLQPTPKKPWFVPLAPQLQARIDQLLAYWENTSSKVQLYQCRFRRWEYNQQLCAWRDKNTHRLAAAIVSDGTIRYAEPDKGRYDVTERHEFAGEHPDGSPKYDKIEEDSERWICDGTSIYEYDFVNRRLYEMLLPPEAQGEGLKNSPLPFVFGAKAADLKERYWVREATPAGVADQFWLEVWPKRAADAQAYQKVEIILSREPFLPMAIHLYAPNYDEKENPTKMVFEFKERQINGGLHKIAHYFSYFISPKTPIGWKRVQKKLAQQPDDAPVPQVGQLPNQDRSK